MHKHEVKVTIFSDFEDQNYDRMTKELFYILIETKYILYTSLKFR